MRKETFMKLLIAGSRSIKDFDLSEHVPKDVGLIISVGADGVDTVAEKYADKNRISKLILRPEDGKYGKAAPLKRNEAMVDIADAVLIIWDGKSHGAMHTAKYAQSKNKPTIIVTVEE